MKAQHPKTIYCKECDHEFEQSSELEKHILSIHKEATRYACKICKAEFVLKWRLRKHMEGHQEMKLRTCHYFNNNIECPFSKVGCKFLHEEASYCRYEELCAKEKCQYRHN